MSSPPETCPPHLKVGGAPEYNVEKDGISSQHKEEAGECLDSCEGDEESSRNVSGVSDISSDLLSKRESASPITGPQTPSPLSGEVTPISNRTGVSDISSDNMDVVSPSHSADVNTPETRDDSCNEASVGGSVDMSDEQIRSTEFTSSRPVEEGEESGQSTGINAEVAVMVTSEPSALEDVVYGGGTRPPPLEGLGTGGALAPSSPQATSSRTPGKRKVM